MTLRWTHLRISTSFFVLISCVTLAASPGLAQGGWTAITGDPVPAAAPGKTDGEQGVATSTENYQFHRQWVETAGPLQEAKFDRVIEYLESVDIDPFANTGKLDQSPRMVYGKPHRWKGNMGSCNASGIEQPSVVVLFDNVYYDFSDDDRIAVFGLIHGNVSYGPLGQPACDGDYCPPITVSGHTFLLYAKVGNFQDCARYTETSLAFIGPSVRLLRPRDANRNNPRTAFVTTKQFRGNPKASWKRFTELLSEMMLQ